MENKESRLIAIKKIISEEKIINQEELLSRLKDMGFNPTQATISRDLKLLQVGKRPDSERGNVFYLPQKEIAANVDTIDNQLLTSAIRSIHFANQLGVIKTVPGYSSSIAVFIDRINRYEILGTIAGDDTLLLIPHHGITSKELKIAIKALFPSLDEALFQTTRR